MAGQGPEPISSIKPSRPVPSLLTTARPLVGDWASGVSWRSAACAPGARWPFCQDDLEATKDDAPDIVAPSFLPYAIYVPYACDWVVIGTEYEADARAQLVAVTPWQMSRELMVGGVGTGDTLASVATDVSAAAAVHPVTGLGTLLEAYFDCPPADDLAAATGAGTGVPIVHAPLSIITSLLANYAIRQQGDVYYGPNCIVSPGPGYPTGSAAEPETNTDPSDTDAWMYISGPVEYALGDIVVRDQTHGEFRRTNRYEVIAERLAIHRFDPCCVFAVGVYQPSPTDSGGV